MPELDNLEILLYAENDSQPPPSRVIDLGRAIHEGGRRRARRRLIGTVGVASVTVLALVTGFALTDRFARPVRNQATIGASPTPTAVAQLPTDHFDPLRFRFAAGWLPSGLPDRLQRSSPTTQELSLTHYTPVKNGEQQVDGTLVVAIFATGVTLPPWTSNVASTPSGDSGPTINGAPSVWAADPGRGRATLGWRWAPNAWAVVTGGGPAIGTGSALRAVLSRIAMSVRVDVDSPVTMPFSLPRPPAPLALVESTVYIGELVGYEGQLAFSDRPDQMDPATGIPRELLVSVEKNSNPAGDQKNGVPNTTIDGNPAQVAFDKTGGRVDLFNVHGHLLTVLVYDPTTLLYVNKGKAIELVRAIQLVPNPADQNNWTATPIR